MIKLKGLSEEQTKELLPPQGLILLGYRGSISHGTYEPSEDPNSIDDIDQVIPTHALIAQTINDMHPKMIAHTRENKNPAPKCSRIVFAFLTSRSCLVEFFISDSFLLKNHRQQFLQNICAFIDLRPA